jgi:hypothetical protein
LATASSGHGKTMTAILRNAFDCKDPLQNISKTSPDKASGAHISMIGHVTRHELHLSLQSVDSSNGVANRIIWIATKRTKKIAIPEQVKWSQDIVHSLQQNLEVFKAPKKIEFTDKAEKLWESWYDSLSDGSGHIEDILARADVHTLRLSMIYAVLDGSVVIEDYHLKAAIAVWEYCEHSAKWVFGIKTGNSIADKIRAALESTPKVMSKTHIANNVLRKNTPSHDLNVALNLLIDAGLILQTKHKTEGASKPTTLYYSPRYEDCIDANEPEPDPDKDLVGDITG